MDLLDFRVTIREEARLFDKFVRGCRGEPDSPFKEDLTFLEWLDHFNEYLQAGGHIEP